VHGDTDSDNAEHLLRLHFAANVSFGAFRFFRPSPKNHASFLSVGRKDQAMAKETNRLSYHCFQAPAQLAIEVPTARHIGS